MNRDKGGYKLSHVYYILITEAIYVSSRQGKCYQAFHIQSP